jgi:drug/metabolite transporter (DMT)-like permease
VRNCSDPDPRKHALFEQPVIQTLQMFIGEMGSWLFVAFFYLHKRYIAKSASAEGGGYTAVSTHEGPLDHDHGDRDADAASIRSTTPINPTAAKARAELGEDRLPLEGWRVTLLGLPAVCDICGTTLMNVGLLFVVPSIYQMTRGALVLFVGLFSVLFLRRKLHLFQWFALVTVVLGVAIVGLAGALYKDPKAAPAATAMLLIREALAIAAREARTPEALRTIIGVFLIAGAQIFTASQFVLEEHILHKYALQPLKVVGWEGLFGFLVTLVGYVLLHLVIGRTDAGRYGYFDLVEGWRQITSYQPIAVSSILIMISIGYVYFIFFPCPSSHHPNPIRLTLSCSGFNYFGLSVTRTVSATSRSTIDTCRTLFIWIVSLFLGWESFKWLQVVGFGLLVYGTFLFNGLVRPPMQRCLVPDIEESNHDDEDDDHRHS